MLISRRRTIDPAIAPKRRGSSVSVRFSPAAALAANSTATTNSTLIAITWPASDSRRRISSGNGVGTLWVDQSSDPTMIVERGRHIGSGVPPQQ